MVKRACVAVAAMMLASCAHHGLVGSPAPQWTLPTSTGTKLSMSAFKGEPVYMNFFATWCPPCNDEAPGVNELQKKYAGSGLRVIGVDELEDARRAQSFVRKYGLTFPAVVDEGTLEDAYAVNGLPVHVFISRGGIIRQITAGEMSKAQIEKSIRALL